MTKEDECKEKVFLEEQDWQDECCKERNQGLVYNGRRRDKQTEGEGKRAAAEDDYFIHVLNTREAGSQDWAISVRRGRTRHRFYSATELE